MATKHYALEENGPERLEISNDFIISLDGQIIGKADKLIAGQEFCLPDGSRLWLRLQKVDDKASDAVELVVLLNGKRLSESPAGGVRRTGLFFLLLGSAWFAITSGPSGHWLIAAFHDSEAGEAPHLGEVCGVGVLAIVIPIVLVAIGVRGIKSSEAIARGKGR